MIFFNCGEKEMDLSTFSAVCRKILSIDNGQVTGNGNVEGDEIEFRCSTNYTLVGDQVLRCTNKGRWNTSQPKCKGNAIIISPELAHI